MKIYYDGAYREVKQLEKIASIRNNNDLNTWEYKSHSLCKIDDGLYLVRTDKKLGPVHHGAIVGKNVMYKSYRIEPEPAVWLLKNGHEKLASLLFPEIRERITTDLKFTEQDERNYRGETLYHSGETKGEAFCGKITH